MFPCSRYPHMGAYSSYSHFSCMNSLKLPNHWQKYTAGPPFWKLTPYELLEGRWRQIAAHALAPLWDALPAALLAGPARPEQRPAAPLLPAHSLHVQQREVSPTAASGTLLPFQHAIHLQEKKNKSLTSALNARHFSFSAFAHAEGHPAGRQTWAECCCRHW